ncbi:septum formation initiator family protein [Phyllobacterium salinisoli]|uniref:Septum formation initiator family protein n=1 Tax=Phyllobacterium salinisoli TaxID=1899321 RepID=A0A368K906_9HYPH|nr:septum formation initiator family protein [Phyllobacterium salinisoli]RCS24560.1 septum formation initiator family protein [Phyllobacterium salinisoli]
MWTKQKRKSIRGRFIVPALAAAFLSYFGFHAYHGEYGLYSRMRLEEQVKIMNDQLATLTGQRIALEREVALVRDGSIEKDMLDEQARRALNLSRPDEVTIMLPRPPSAY